MAGSNLSRPFLKEPYEEAEQVQSRNVPRPSERQRSRILRTIREPDFDRLRSPRLRIDLQTNLEDTGISRSPS